MAYINLGQVVWPVGAIYMSSSNTSPANLFGGTWKKVDDDRFWLPSNNSLTYGGESTHTLTIAEMPSHQHMSTDTGRTGNIGSGAGYTVPVINNYGGNAAYTSWTGGSAAHNNIPAYRTCYCWYRTS